MAPRFRFSAWVVSLTAGVLLLASLGTAPAQTLSDGWQALDNKYRGEKSRLVHGFFKGDQVDPSNNMHVEAIDLHAKVATYGVYLNHLENHPGKIDSEFKDFERDVDAIIKSKNRQAMQPLAEVFRDKVRVHALKVIQFDKAKPIHKIHNARILAKIAELGQGKLAETLVTVLQDDKQNDGVHYYALRGLRTLLGLPQQMPPILNKDEQAKCAEAIIAFLGRKPNLSSAPLKEEIDGFRILRREGVRALAQIHTPAVSAKVRPALVLARFAGEDESLQPPPRIDERLEAAIGLARMTSAQSKDYQPDYAAGQIAKALGAFVTAAESEAKDTTELADRTRPWKIDAARLSDALAALKVDSGKNAYVNQVVNRGTRLLQGIVRGRQLEAGEKTWFTTSQSDPPRKELFKGVADSVVKPAKPAEAPEK